MKTRRKFLEALLLGPLIPAALANQPASQLGDITVERFPMPCGPIVTWGPVGKSGELLAVGRDGFPVWRK